MGGFTPKASPPPPPAASKAEDDDDDDSSEDDDDGDASSSDTDEMSSWHSYPLSLMTKKGSSFVYELSHT